ncbi:predicted protein [Entamoeba histolytica]
MEELIKKNNQLIKEVVKPLPNIQQSIDDTTKNYQYYIGSIQNEVFKIKPDETYEQAIKRGEGIIDKMHETERRRKIVTEKGEETINQIEIMKNKMSRIIEECNSDKETLDKTRNELIDKIISIEEMIMKNKIFRKPKERDTIAEEFNKKKEEWEKHYSDYLERKKRKEEERLRIMKGMNTMEEMLQLEEWTNRKVGNILFDSDKDDWNVNKSVFDERIMNKEHIIIIIEDEDRNKFGGYVNSKVDKIHSYIKDSKSFVFSLESKGRIEGMKKFDIKHTENTFYLHSQSSDGLFGFGKYGSDIFMCKENNKTKSWCYQYSYSYEGISNTLCGKEYPDRFTTKRIMVIEMK